MRRLARRAGALAARPRRADRAATGAQDRGAAARRRDARRMRPHAAEPTPPAPRVRAPSCCATRSRRSSRPTTPTAPCVCRTSTRSSPPPARRPTSAASSPSWCSIRRPRRPTSRAARQLDEDWLVLQHRPLGQGPGMGVGPRALALRRQLPVRPVAASDGRRSRRSAGCSTSRSRAPGATLHLYVPMRYYHRPRGLDDGHGYGKPSRFLTDGVQALCRRTDCTGLATGPGEAGAGPGEAGGSPGRRIEVSVDALFG